MQKLANHPVLYKNFKIFTFMLVIINLIVTTALFFADRAFFFQYCSCFLLFLYFLRIFIYYYLDFHVFLHDFCYFSMSIQTYYILVDQMQSTDLFIVTFIFTNGRVLLGLYLFSDAFAPHEIINYTSFHLHFFQGLASWTYRWHYLTNVPEVDVLYFLKVSLPFLTAYVLEYALVNLTFDKYYKKNNICTVQDYYLTRAMPKGTMTHSFVHMFGKNFVTLNFYIVNYFYYIFHFLIALMCYQYYYVHTAYLGFSFLFGLYRGATFYFNKWQKDVYE